MCYTLGYELRNWQKKQHFVVVAQINLFLWHISFVRVVSFFTFHEINIWVESLYTKQINILVKFLYQFKCVDYKWKKTYDKWIQCLQYMCIALTFKTYGSVSLQAFRFSQLKDKKGFEQTFAYCCFRVCFLRTVMDEHWQGIHHRDITHPLLRVHIYFTHQTSSNERLEMWFCA